MVHKLSNRKDVFGVKQYARFHLTLIYIPDLFGKTAFAPQIANQETCSVKKSTRGRICQDIL